MSLSQELATLAVPENTGNSASVFTASGALGALASAFHVTLPPTNLSAEQRQGFLRSWQSAAQYVVSRLYDPNEIIDEEAVVRGFREVEASVQASAAAAASLLTTGVFQTVFRLLTGSLKSPFQLPAESVRSAVLYVYTSAAAGVAFHSSKERTLLGEAALLADYLVRLGAFQAVVALGRSGLLDPLAKPNRGSSGLGALPLVPLVIAAIAVAICLAYIISSVYETGARNATILELQKRSCEADPGGCSSVTADLARRLATGPAPEGSIADSIGRYSFYAVLLLGGWYLLPSFLSSLRPRRRRGDDD